MIDPAIDEVGRRQRELGLRVVSAIALAAAALALTWSGVWPFAVLIGGVGLIVVWEWGRVVRGAGRDAAFFIGGLAIAAACIATAWGQAHAGIGVLALGAILSGVVGRPALSAALGVAYAGLPAVALIWLRASPRYGLECVLLVLFVVWATDTGAFIAGRAIGGPKLWARVSPNKTWAGLAGGVLAGGVVAYALAVTVGSLSPITVVAIGLALALISQIGDLLESAIKRSHGVKDASSLIPGHGGFMDRVDGLVLAAIAAALLGAVVDLDAPGAVLLALR